MKPIKKSMIVFGAIAVAILMVSTATAVEQANSEPIRNYVKGEEQEDFMNQLEETAASADIGSIKEEYTITDFISFLLSDEFIDFMKSQEITDFLSSDLFLEIYNSDKVQEFIQSDEFRDFTISNVARDFLKKYRAKEGQSLIESTNVNNQCTLSEYQSEDLAVGINSNMQTTAPIDGMDEVYNAGGIDDILLLFAYLLIGGITWPIAIGVFSLLGPILGVLYAWEFFTSYPGNLITRIIGSFLLFFETVMMAALWAIFWPICWGLILI